jgi:predicted regulator of Ras-like GTPase activity (Roadblock/LC7/MglB family)
MIEVLESLNQEVGVKGSMVLTKDGMEVASAMQAGTDATTVAAIAANIVMSTLNALESMGEGSFKQFVFTASHGKMIFVETGIAYLVVVCDTQIRLDVTMLAISAAARKISNLGSMTG